MKAAIQMKAETRAQAGKGAARAARRAGFVPVNIYAHGKENVSANVEARVLANEYFRGGFMNKVVSLELGGKEMFAIPREIQLNPVTDKIEHADFMAVDAKSVVKVFVPVHFVNTTTSVGIKRGGVLNIVSHKLELLCPVANIPASIDIDLASVDIGQSIQMENVVLPEGVKPASKSRKVTVASIGGRSKEEEVTPTAAPVAGAVPATKAAAATAAAAAAPAAGAAKPAAKK